MEQPRVAARLPPTVTTDHALSLSSIPAGITAFATAYALVAVTLATAAVTQGTTKAWFPDLLLWAAPAAVIAGLVQIAMIRWRLARPLERLRKLSELAAHAEELSRQLTLRTTGPQSQHRAAGPAEHPQEASDEAPEPGSPSPGRRRAGLARRASTGDDAQLDPGPQLTELINHLMSALDTEQSYRSIVDATGDVVLLVDSLGQITVASDSVQQVLQLAPEQMAGQPLARYVHAGDLEKLLDLLEDFDAHARVDRRAQRPRLRLRTADNSWRVLEWVLSQWPAGQSASTLLTGRDVTEQVELQDELVHQAQHDSLTGLPNRVALTVRLAELVAQSSAARPIAVLMIDLDRFKVINDSLGHACGDLLLTQVGGRLLAVLRPGDMLARLGGDEFAVVIQTGGLEGAELVAGRLISQLEDPFLVESARLTVEASIGIAISHGTARAEPADSATLLSEADIAMYRAKETGIGVAVFEPERDRAKSERLEASDELRAAIVDGQLVLHYQPIIDLINTRVAGLEALVRWQHPTRGLLPPSEFLPIAEETGLIARLSHEVLDQVLRQVALWMGQGWPLPVSVNLSPNWLHQADVPDDVVAALARHNVPAALLRLEITEAAVIVDPQQSLTRLNRLRKMGVRLSLDDFGTGFSSMTHLRTLPIDQLKVDRTFVRTMVTSEQDAIIVRAAIELGHNLGLSVVAEGIEDPDTLARVMAAGCSLAQGFYFAKPMAPDLVLDWIEPRFPASRAGLSLRPEVPDSAPYSRS